MVDEYRCVTYLPGDFVGITQREPRIRVEAREDEGYPSTSCGWLRPIFYGLLQSPLI